MTGAHHVFGSTSRPGTARPDHARPASLPGPVLGEQWIWILALPFPGGCGWASEHLSSLSFFSCKTAGAWLARRAMGGTWVWVCGICSLRCCINSVLDQQRKKKRLEKQLYYIIIHIPQNLKYTIHRFRDFVESCSHQTRPVGDHFHRLPEGGPDPSAAVPHSSPSPGPGNSRFPFCPCSFARRRHLM